jgi:hypothetical protein
MSDSEPDFQRLSLILLTTPFTWAFRAFIMIDLWLWFIVPLGVAEVGMAHMYGITLVGNLVSGLMTSSSEDKPVLEIVFTSVFISLCFWGIAAIAHSFM